MRGREGTGGRMNGWKVGWREGGRAGGRDEKRDGESVRNITPPLRSTTSLLLSYVLSLIIHIEGTRM